MLQVEIRVATPADAEAIAVVHESAIRTLRQTYRPNLDAIAHKQSIESTLTRLVAVLNALVVGAVDYRITSECVHFLSLDVLAEYRRQGVATQLIHELERIGRRAGATRLTTYTVMQTGNCTIFERMGFQVISEEPSPDFESDSFDVITEAYLERRIP